MNTMQDLLNAGQVLGRSEMKKIMAGSGGMECTRTVNCSWGTCSCTGTNCRSTDTGCEADQADGSVDTCDC